MSWRTVIITNQCKLDYRMGYLVIRGEDVKRVFLDELAVLVIENPAVSMTGCLIEALTEKKIKTVFCDSGHNPVSELVPYYGSHDSSQKIRLQTAWGDGVKALVWREIVGEKIRQQATFLREIKREREAEMLSAYVGQVEPGDATNREGHAAKVYFNALFGMDFTRDAETPINAALNYGYGVVLSAFNREIAAAGYLTQVGIFHDNMFNRFNLSCDLMEPFRILVDREVRRLMPESFDKAEKHAMWALLNNTVEIESSRQTVLNAIKIYSRSVFNAMNDADPYEISFYRVE